MAKPKKNEPTPASDTNEAEPIRPADLRYHGDGSGMIPCSHVEEAIGGRHVHEANIAKAKKIRAENGT